MMEPTTSDNTNTTAPQPSTSTAFVRVQGKGARQKRSENRRKARNVSEQKSIQSANKQALGLSESTALAQLSPSGTSRPIAVHVNLLGCNEAIAFLLQQAQSIAQRPLALLLTNDNILTYRKVCCFLFAARVACSQVAAGASTGVEYNWRSYLTSDEVRQIDGRLTYVPNALAWIFSNLGLFQHSSQTVCPVVQIFDEAAPHVTQLLTGMFPNVIQYVNHYAEAQVPLAERPQVVLAQSFLPRLALTAAGNFTEESVAFWQDVGDEDYHIFQQVNLAMREQQLTVDGMAISSTLGSAIPIVRFPLIERSSRLHTYYSTESPTPQLVRSALALRLGVDATVPQPDIRSPFLSDQGTALFSGTDVPSIFLRAQMTMLSRHEIR